MPDRPWARFELALFAAVLGVFAIGTPLGLDRVGAAPGIAAGLGLEVGATAGLSPLDLLALRLGALLALGDIGTRASLVSAVLGALSAVVLARLVMDVCGELRPPPHARREAGDLIHEPVAGAAAAGLLALGLTAFEAATSAARPLAALLATLVGLRAALRVALHVEDAVAGTRLALVAGVAAGAGPAAPLFLWPPAALLTLWALRRGERWPLLAPLAFTAGLAVLLLPLAAAAPGEPAFSVFAPLGPGEGPAWGVLGAAREAGEQLGVIALLLAAVGAFVLVTRAPFAAALVLVSETLGLLLAARGVGLRGAGGPGAPALEAVGIYPQGHAHLHAFLVLVAAAAASAGVGVFFLAGKLRLARVPTALVLAVTALVSPALDGGAARWRRDARLAPRLLDAAHARAAVGARVTPGTREMEGLLLYGAALGLRPDLEIASRPAVSAPRP